MPLPEREIDTDETAEPVSAAPGTPLPPVPPLPPGLSPETAYLGSMIAWSGQTQTMEVRAMRSEVRRGFRAQAAALADIDKDIEAIPKVVPDSAFGKLAAYVAESPLVKQALVLAVASFIGVGTAGLTAYLSLRTTGGVASPAQIVTGSEPSPAAPVTVITSASATPTVTTPPLDPLVAPVEGDDPEILHGDPLGGGPAE